MLTRNMSRIVGGWLIVYVALLAATLENTQPYHGDESYYTVSAIEMMRSGDALTPVYFGQFRFQKPILAYWMTAIGYHVFGIDLWSGRIAFLAAACGLLAVTYFFADLLYHDRRIAWLCVLMLASSTLFIEYARVSMTDMPLALFTALGLYWFCKALAATDPRRAAPQYIMAVAAVGMACAVKGIWGMPALLAMPAYLLAARPPHFKRSLAQLAHPLALLLFAACAAGWYLYAYVAHPDEMLRQFQTESSANIGFGLAPIFGRLFFYLRVLLTAYLPFTALAAYLCVKKRLAPPAALQPVAWQAGLLLLFCVVVVSEQRSRYMLAMFPAVTLLIASPIARSGLTALASKIAIAWAALQLLVFVCYPVFLGEPLRELARYWERELRGDVAAYKLPERETGWLQALTHGRLREYRGGADYVILEEKHAADFERGELIRRAAKLHRVTFEHFRLVKTYKTYLLIKPSKTNLR